MKFMIVNQKDKNKNKELMINNFVFDRTKTGQYKPNIFLQ